MLKKVEIWAVRGEIRRGDRTMGFFHTEITQRPFDGKYDVAMKPPGFLVRKLRSGTLKDIDNIRRVESNTRDRTRAWEEFSLASGYNIVVWRK